jgi:DNA polymerase III epsilon subunit-like protein
MPIICGIDCETTGLDLEKDWPTEVGWIVCDTANYRPLAMRSMLVTSPVPLPDEVGKLTGLTSEVVSAHGSTPAVVGQKIVEDIARFGVSYMVAHNGEAFDKPMLAKLHRDVDMRPWIDTRHDVPYPDSMSSRRLVHLAAEHGFLNPAAHSALADVQTMLQILRHYDFAEVARTALSPWVILRAIVSFDDKDKAKKLRYTWEKPGPGNAIYPKQWVKL